MSTIQRMDRNRIQRLKNDVGEWVEGQEEVLKVILEHYHQVYDAKPTQSIDECLSIVPQIVTYELNEELNKEVFDAEVKGDVFNLGALKAPRANGLNGSFYRKHWDIVRGIVRATVKEFFCSGKLPSKINKTQVVLVPKVIRPKTVSQFCTISCYNFFFLNYFSYFGA